MSDSHVSASDRIPISRYVRVRIDDENLSKPTAIEAFAGTQGWVLLADPGAGKTDIFKFLSQQEGGCFISARNFIELGLPADWTPPLFIDGLDEVSAGGTHRVGALGQIRSKLHDIQVPKFRISCREADWRGSVDSKALQDLVGEANFAELHLTLLDATQVIDLIAYWKACDWETAAKFREDAIRHDLDGLLVNPQTLRMLVAAVQDKWPDSKAKVYELACTHLVREPNPEHLASQHQNPLSENSLLEAAGFLSAVALLSGSVTIAKHRTSATKSRSLLLTELIDGTGTPSIAACRAAIETSLFKGDGLEGFTAIHRTVAEHLGAKFLVSRIQAGLPYLRVLALMLGDDGGVVPELRGLHAWVAALVPADLRRQMIERDPLGLILNGDVKDFQHNEKLTLLKALRAEASRYTHFRSQHWSNHPFGALATSDMEPDFRTLLASSERSPAHLVLVDCVVDAIAHGQPMRALSSELDLVVRDKTFWPGTRTEALRTLIRYANEDDNWSAIKQLMGDIHNSRVEDLEDELLGTLLAAMYPKNVPPSEIWNYFRNPKSEQLIGAYWRFWHSLSKNSTGAEIPELLDALIARKFELDDRRDHLGSPELIGDLLIAGVTQHGLLIDTPHLFKWLSLGISAHFYCPLPQEKQFQLRKWLCQHPEKYRALFSHALGQLPERNDNAALLWIVDTWLYNARVTEGEEAWFLSLAESCTKDALRHQLVSEAVNLIWQRQSSNAALRTLEDWARHQASDAQWVETQLQMPYPLEKSWQDHINFEIKQKREREEADRLKVNFFREALPSFNQELAHLGALHEVGVAYLDFYRHANKDSTAEKRLLELLNGDKEWVRTALHGLRQCLFRSDLPSASKIIELHLKGQRYTLSTPSLAAMELRFSEDPDSALALHPDILGSVAAFRLTNDYYDKPAWFRQMLISHTELVARLMQEIIAAQIAMKKEHADGLHALAHDKDYAAIATRIAPTLLAKFPIKAHRDQLQNLRHLIFAMMGRVAADTQIQIIHTKLNSKGMDIAQHVYWLTAGVQVAPEQFLAAAKGFIPKNQIRVTHLYALINEQRERELPVSLSVSVVAFFIELLGPRSNPSWRSGSGRGGFVTPDMTIGRYVEGLLSFLAGSPEEDAKHALGELLERRDMAAWIDSLSRAIFEQRISRRKALFKPATVQQVCNTLANLKPSSAADLWALTVAHLTQLRDTIRNGNTNDYSQYWADAKPKLEDDCRNALLSDLRHLFAPLNVLAEPEGRYADDKRADIKVMFGAYQIPIEIKREMHPGVWKAIKPQLVDKYGREKSSDGYGIYVVFWFTGTELPAPVDGGPKVRSPAELQQRLTLTVPEELRNKIAIVVIDCSTGHG